MTFDSKLRLGVECKNKLLTNYCQYAILLFIETSNINCFCFDKNVILAYIPILRTQVITANGNYFSKITDQFLNEVEKIKMCYNRVREFV